MTEKFQQIIKKIYPTAELISSKKLEGGVSAQVFALEINSPHSGLQKFVLRQYGAANLQADPMIAAHEFRLLRLLHTNGLLVPNAIYVDETCKILDSPYLIVEFVDGEMVDEPSDVLSYVRQMADALANIHLARISNEIDFLPDQLAVFTKKLADAPAQMDDSLSETQIRNTLTKHWPPQQSNTPTLLHGDFWPGNTMWKDGRLAGVIDWEDAGIGDPLADLANGRLENLMFFGVEASEEFTNRYKSKMPKLDYTNLPYWDLCAALRPVGKMADWGLDDATYSKLQAGHKQFVDAAIAALKSN